MNCSALNLNLLVVFDGIMHERTLTRAGQRLGMSQPAVSHALARLRHVLKDELFVRTPEGMLPTPRAARMAEPVRAALQNLQVTLQEDEFDASQSSRSFTIAANNHAARAVIPTFARRMATLAPSVVLDVRANGSFHILDQLDEGDVDLALTTLLEGGDRFKCTGLLNDEYVAILSRNSPVAAEPVLLLESFVALSHVINTSVGCDTNFVDDALAERGLARHVTAKVPLHSLIFMLIGSNSLAVVPRRVAVDLVAIGPFTMRPLPFPSPRIALSMIWHRRVDNHPAHRWLRRTLRDSVTGA
jgi:DNA-binding transcriptional LysR family regulator